MEGVVEGLVRWANRYGNYQYRVNFLECLKGLISLYRPGCEGGGSPAVASEVRRGIGSVGDLWCPNSPPMTPVNPLVIRELSTASRLLEWCSGKRDRMLHEVRILDQHRVFLPVPHISDVTNFIVLVVLICYYWT